MIQMGFFQRSKVVFREVFYGLAIKECWCTMLFKAILASFVPSFGSYFYYYTIDVAGITQWEYSLLGAFGYLTLITGSVCYQAFFRNAEFRIMVLLACFINLFGAITTMFFCRD